MFTEDSALNEQLKDFHCLLKKAWCLESCSISLREKWSNANPAKGQCFVTALAVQSFFGGDVYELHMPSGEIHFYNRIDGKIIDLTSEQFKCRIDIDFYSGGIKTDVKDKLCDSIKQKRYEVLSERIEELVGTNKDYSLILHKI